VGKPPCGAEPRIELGPALQQADALPTEQRRTIFNPANFLKNYKKFKTPGLKLLYETKTRKKSCDTFPL
jgi:hypothetical protein